MRAILFDFDGTLADSFPAITASTNHVRQCYGYPPLTEAEVRSFVGYGLEHLLATLVPTAPSQDAVAAYRAHHQDVMIEKTSLFPGVLETLEVLQKRQFQLAVCSNKKVAFTKQLVTGLGLSPYFAEVLGPDDVGVPKPDPAMLLEAMRRLGVTTASTIYVGDMEIDVQSARAAGVPVWIILGGSATPEIAAKSQPDRLFHSFPEILSEIPAH